MDKKKLSVAALLAYLPLIPVFWFVAKPLITDALAEDLTSSVQQQVAPIKGAFVTLLDREIRELTFEISKMEFAKENDEEWSAFNEQELTNMKLALAEAEEAKEELKQGE
jgi:hypothetical protein